VSHPVPEPTVWTHADEERASRALWAALMLTSDLQVCRSILLGRPVLACQLDVAALRRARRGEPLPPPDEYFRVRPGHLVAGAVGAPLPPARGRLPAERSRQ
jgi:hypothetical protein